MSNRHLVLALMRSWFTEENLALTRNNNDLVTKFLEINFRLVTALRRVQELENELEDTQNILNTHVDVNFQMQERIDYLENFIIRLRDFPRPLTHNQARRELFPDSDTESD